MAQRNDSFVGRAPAAPDPAVPDANLLTVRGLIKRYPGFELRGVDLDVPAGAVVGFVGANGAGKTTTLRAILGLTRPDAGVIGLFGRPVGELSRSEETALKQRIGVVFDACAFPKQIRVRDVRRLMRGAYAAWDDDAFARHLRSFGIDEAKKVEDLSRGMGMKLMLTCALCHGADLLLLDEPTAGLDPLAREEVLDMLRRFLEKEGRAILMSSHITSDLERIADYVVCIDAGQVAFSVEKDQISELAGIARLRAAEFVEVRDSGFAADAAAGSAAGAQGLRFSRKPYGIDLLVPDRAAFARAFPQVPVDRASIEDYMALMLKGEELR